MGVLPFEVFRDVLAELQSGMSALKDRPGRRRGLAQEHQVLIVGSRTGKGQGFHEECCHHGVASRQKHGRLLFRFAACTRNLEVRRGTLGVMLDYGSPTAENLVKATQRAYTQFCTHRLGKPGTMTGLEEPEVDYDLLRHMRMISDF